MRVHTAYIPRHPSDRSELLRTRTHADLHSCHLPNRREPRFCPCKAPYGGSIPPAASRVFQQKADRLRSEARVRIKWRQTSWSFAAVRGDNTAPAPRSAAAHAKKRFDRSRCDQSVVADAAANGLNAGGRVRSPAGGILGFEFAWVPSDEPAPKEEALRGPSRSLPRPGRRTRDYRRPKWRRTRHLE